MLPGPEDFMNFEQGLTRTGGSISACLVKCCNGRNTLSKVSIDFHSSSRVALRPDGLNRHKRTLNIWMPSNRNLPCIFYHFIHSINEIKFAAKTNVSIVMWWTIAPFWLLEVSDTGEFLEFKVQEEAKSRQYRNHLPERWWFQSNISRVLQSYQITGKRYKEYCWLKYSTHRQTWDTPPPFSHKAPC